MLISKFWYVISALLPAVLILFYIFKQDVFPEPKKIVFKTFLFGCATTLGLRLLITDIDTFSETYLKGETYNFFDSFFRAAFLEEFFKLIVLIFFCTRKVEFDEPMDGIVYGVAASLGFAAYENISYILYTSSGPSYEIAVIRAFTAVPMHALCGVTMGFFISQTLYEKRFNFVYLFLSLAVPVFMHGLYNFSWGSPNLSSAIPNFILLISFSRALYLLRKLKYEQIEGRMYTKKQFNITIVNFSIISLILCSGILILSFLMYTFNII